MQKKIVTTGSAIQQRESTVASLVGFVQNRPSISVTLSYALHLLVCGKRPESVEELTEIAQVLDELSGYTQELHDHLSLISQSSHE
jgi:hypothetical protein